MRRFRSLPLLVLSTLFILLSIIPTFVQSPQSSFAVAVTATQGTPPQPTDAGPGSGDGPTRDPRTPRIKLVTRTPYPTLRPRRRPNTSTPQVFPSQTPFVSQNLMVAVVTKLEDTDDLRCDPNDCSLREAIKNITDGATITFAPGLTGVIKLNTTGDPTGILYLQHSVKIIGPGPKSDAITLDGGGITRILSISRPNPYSTTPDPNSERVKVDIQLLTFANAHGTAGAAVEVGGVDVSFTNCTFKGGSGTTGAAISNFSGKVKIVASTFTNNVAPGGVIQNSRGAIEIINSTFFEPNGVLLNSGGSVRITGSTFALIPTDRPRNIRIIDVIAGFEPDQSYVEIGNSILYSPFNNSNCDGDVRGFGKNMTYPVAGCGNAVVADPMLGDLRDNGGSTLTIALKAGSPAFDTGDAALCSEDAQSNLDQRGVVRIDSANGNNTCNLGAYED